MSSRGIWCVAIVLVASCGDDAHEDSAGGAGASGGSTSSLGGASDGGAGIGGTAEGGGGASPTTMTIGPDGGRLETPEGVVLFVPPGALDAATEISIGLAQPMPSGTASQAFELLPDGLVFSVPAELTLPIDRALLGGAPASELALASLSDSGERWGTGWALIDASQGLVTGHILHFSQWAVVPAPPNGCTVNYGCMKQCAGVDVPDLCCSQFKSTCRSRLTTSFPEYVACYASCVGTPSVRNFGSSQCMDGCCEAGGWTVESEGTCYSPSASVGEAQAILDCARDCFDAPDTGTLCGGPIQFDACQWTMQNMPLMGDECDGALDGTGINLQFLATDLGTFPAQDWGSPAVIHVGAGSYDQTSVMLPLSCATAVSESGSMTGTWTGSAYVGTWTFGSSNGNFTLSPAWL